MRSHHDTWFPDITSMIRLDHTHVLALFRRFRPDVSARRKQAIVASACLALEIHARLEEEIFYPAMRRAIGSDEVLDKSVPEHEQMRGKIQALHSMAPGSPEQEDAFRSLMRTVLHHVADEETVLLPRAEEVLRDELGTLGMRMTQRRMQLLAPHAGEVAATTARAFPILSAVTLLGTLAVGLTVAGRTRGHRALPRH